MSTIVNAMTVDVEEYFQVSAFEPLIASKDWGAWESRVELATNSILDLFAEKGIKATFFTLGYVAQKHPQLVRRIINDGHELGSHGMRHVRATEQTQPEFFEDISTSKKILEDCSGVEVIGYRAASFSVNRDNMWALESMEEAGYRYSSSIYPVRHDLYGVPDFSRFALVPEGVERLVEVPVTTTQIAGRNIPIGGGGYFRLLPYALSKNLMQRVNRDEKQPCIFYFHPWEVDPDQPRPEGLGLKTRFRHYVNQEKMLGKISRLLDDFSWSRMDQIFLGGTAPELDAAASSDASQ